MKYKIYIVVLLAFCSCNINNISSYKTPEFSFPYPGNWTIIKKSALDSCSGTILTDNGDTLYFDYGLHVEPMSKNDTFYVPGELKKSFLGKGYNLGNAIFIESGHLDSLYQLRTIVTTRDKHAMLFVPKFDSIIFRGISGIFINNIKETPAGIIKFRIYGNDLKKESDKGLTMIINNIVFKE